MRMHNPPHPGEIIADSFLEPNGLGIREVARSLNVAPSTFARIVRGEGAISPEMAWKLSVTLGPSPEMWLGLQMDYDLWQAEQTQEHLKSKPLQLAS
ncbi:MAG: HigA family addiction module antitoxin [Thermosynechococcaceae cyanobacterium]